MPFRTITASLILFLSGAAAHAETLNLLIWETYIEKTILDEWSAKTGVAVRQTFYDSGDARDEILSDPSSNVDLAVVSEAGSRLYGRRGILERLTPTTVPAFEEYPKNLLGSCSEFGVPYFWGTMGILYRADKISIAPTSWRNLMEPALALKGHVAMFDDPAEMFVAPLIALGKSINATDAPTMKAAFELLKIQAPYVRTYDYVMTSSQNETYGSEIYMALGYSGDQYALNEMPNSLGTWEFVMPAEGSLLWVDCLSVATSSPRKALALDLLNHIAAASSARVNAISLRRPTANLKALDAIPKAMLEDPAIYPPNALLAKSQSTEELSAEAIQTRRRIIGTLVNFRDSR